ncbi:Hsp70 family protein [Collinsella sp. HCP3S3_E6]|uniref:Hsp70 family protein n=2 Tax=unclassified Collinsella TaxID=2637548 RepID=UPI003F8AAB8A
MGIAVGIDLGTTFSAVACVGADGEPRILPNSSGEHTTPSVVAVAEDGSVVCGEAAKEAQLMGDANVASFYKTNMGNAGYVECLRGCEFDATTLSSTFLRHLIADVSRANGVQIDSAVVTVPAYFEAPQREATLEALRRTGVRALGTLNEPSAAAYAYGLMSADAAGERTILIYDLGGGTFDVTVARLSGREIRVLSSTGNHQLGGRQWDSALSDFILDQLCDARGLDRDDVESDLTPSDINTLAVVSEQVKRDLTNRARTRARVMAESVSGTVEVTREDFEEATRHLLTLTTDCCEEALREAGLTWAQVDGYILVGGSTKMPQVREYLTGKVGSGPIGGNVNPDEAVALGAAVYAAQKCGTAFSLPGASAAAPRFSLGALPKLVDCTAHSMGMIAESEDRSRYVNSTIIAKNTPVPATNSREYAVRATPGRPGSLEIYLLQGDDPAPLNNTVVGKYVVPKIPGERGRETHVLVSYSYTENATIEVGAALASSGKALEVERAEVESDLSRFLNAPTDNDATVENHGVSADVMICIDVSGSMYGEGFEAAEKAATAFLDSIEGSGVHVGVMYFGSNAKVCCDPTLDYGKVSLLTSNSDRGFRSTLASECGGGTYNPLGVYADWLDAKMDRSDAKADVLLILTDGCWCDADKAIQDAESLKDDGVTIIGIGTPDADLEFLKEISTSDSYAGLFDFSELGTAFSSIGRSISSGSGISI